MHCTPQARTSALVLVLQPKHLFRGISHISHWNNFLHCLLKTISYSSLATVCNAVMSLVAGFTWQFRLSAYVRKTT